MANDGTVKIGVDLDEKEFKSGVSKLGGVAKGALGGVTSVAKSAVSAFSAAVTASTAAATAGAVAIGKIAQSALSAYGDYEQLVGGVETLFKSSSDKVMEYANNAYKTAGMSANEYMETVTSFSARLLQGLGGDTAAAAEIADKAIVDMADNANKMGTDIEAIQNAYQGFAKQNYTMLDNLKLGYGGTASEMARLINNSGVLGSTMEVTAETVNEVSFDKIIEAIHVVQDRMGITGTTAKEASETIQGSVNAMKAAWQNFVTGMADENQDIEQLTQNLVDSVITVANNIVPRLQELLPRLADGLGQLVGGLIPYIPETLERLLPSLINAAASLVTNVAKVLPQLISTAIKELPNILYVGVEIISTLGNGIIESLPQLLGAVNQAIDYIAIAFRNSLPNLVEQIPSIVQAIADAFIDATDTLAQIGPGIIKSISLGISKSILKLQANLPQIIDSITDFLAANISEFVNGGVLIIKSLAVGIMNNVHQIGQATVEIISTIAKSLSDALPELIPAIVSVLLEIVDTLTDPNNLVALIDAATQIIVAIAQGIANALPKLTEKIPELVKAIAEALIAAMPIILEAVIQIAALIIEGIGNAIKSEFSGIFSAFGGGSISSSSGGGAGRQRTISAYSLTGNETIGSTDGEGLSLTASALSREAAIQAFESAMPSIVDRVSLATNQMAPPSAYSMPSFHTSSGGEKQTAQTQVIMRPNWTIRFTGDTAQLGRILKPVIDAEDTRVGVGV